jgi:hypothetical protein
MARVPLDQAGTFTVRVMDEIVKAASKKAS